MPHQLRTFTRGLRQLYTDHSLCGDDTTAKFIDVRDSVRCDAVIYVSEILPLANFVMLNISEYFDNYLALNFKDWKESLEDIVKEIEGYENGCKYLIQMHESLMTSLKKREDDANVSTIEMEKLSKELEDKMNQLNVQAKTQEKEAQSWDSWGQEWHFYTLGWSTSYARPEVSSRQADAQKSRDEANAKKTSAEIATHAAHMTKTILIPCITDFLKGVSATQAFFAETKVDLAKMNRKDRDSDTKVKMMRHFNVMKMNAEDIKKVCKTFFSSIAEVSSFCVKIIYLT